MFDFGCSYGGVSIGAETASLGLSVSRDRIPLEVASQTPCGKRLSGTIFRGGADADASQQNLPGMDDAYENLKGVFDVKRFSVSPKEIGFRLTFSLASIDVSTLAHFAKQSGRLVIDAVEDLPDDADGDDDDLSVDDHDDVGPVAKRKGKKPLKGQKSFGPCADPGAKMPLSALIKFGKQAKGDSKAEKLTTKKCEAIASAVGGDTVGHLEEAMRNNEWWHRDIDGFGEHWLTILQDSHVAFRQQYPMPDDKQEAAYKAGCEAALDGKTDNPFSDDDPERDWWNKGYADTEKETPADESGTVFDQAESKETEGAAV